METRHQRRKRMERVLLNAVDDESINEDELQSNGDFENQSQMIKEVLRRIEKDQKELKESCERVFQENTRLAERIKKLESHESESRINNTDFETC